MLPLNPGAYHFTSMSDKQDRQRTLGCSWCFMSFSKKEHLARHLRTHTREKPFACKRCGKAFGRKSVSPPCFSITAPSPHRCV
ncbi:hypothetical protein F1880_007275 [Penicillium rolfsii]|nr:hypothetical protein F1880_007275 [Penicillium rolfsii]